MGVTIFCLAFSNYFCNKLRKKTAYLEINASNVVDSLSNTYGISCYATVTLRKLPMILQEDYSIFILDFGVFNPNTYAEFCRCDLQILIGSVRPWKMKPYCMLLEKIIKEKNTHRKLLCFASLGMKTETILIPKCEKVCVHPFPFLTNPFQLNSSEWIFFERILKGI